MNQVRKIGYSLIVSFFVVWCGVQGDDLPALPDLPDHGYGFLELIKNDSTFPVGVFFDKSVHDALPPDSMIRLKDLSSGNYYRVVRTKDSGIVCVPDTKDINDTATQFRVRRYVDYNLNDFITFSSAVVKDNVMSIDDSGKIVFGSIEYQDPSLTSSHWTLVPEDEADPLAKLSIVNQSNHGSMHVVTKDEEYYVTPPVTKAVNQVWGTSLPNVESNVLKYGSIVCISDAFDSRAQMWTHKTEPFGIKNSSEILFYDGNEGWLVRSAMGRFMILNADNPGYRGPVKYKDKVAIYSLWSMHWPIENNHIMTPDTDLSGETKVSTKEGRWWTKNDSRDWGASYSSVVVGGNDVRLEGDDGYFSIVCAPSVTNVNPSVDDYDKAQATDGVVRLGDAVFIQSLSKGAYDLSGRSYLWRNTSSRWGGWHHEILIKESLGVPDPNKTVAEYKKMNNRSVTQGRFMFLDPDERDIRKKVLRNGNEPMSSADQARFFLGMNEKITQTYTMDQKSVVWASDATGWKTRYLTKGSGKIAKITSVQYGLETKDDLTQEAQSWLQQDSGMLKLPSSVAAIKGDKFYGRVKDLDITVELSDGAIVSRRFNDTNVNQYANGWDGSSPDKIIKAAPVAYDIVGVAVYKPDDVWAISRSNDVLRYDGVGWKNYGVNASDISVGSDGVVWRVDNGKLFYQKKSTWVAVTLGDSKAIKVAACDKDEAWVITKDGKVLRGKGSNFQTVPFTDGIPVSIDAASSDGSVFVVNDEGNLYSYVDNTWGQLPGENFADIAVQSANVAWAVDRNRQVYHWDGATWTQEPGIYLSTISISHATEIAQAAQKGIRTITTAYTVDKDDAPYAKTQPDAQIAIEVIKLGLGSGGITAGSTVPFAALPIAKRPKVSGYVMSEFSNFSESSQLDLTPLVGRGAAWLTQTFKTPGQASVSFLANSGPSGDVHVTFGTAPTQDVVCRVVIGADDNNGIKIFERIGVDANGDPILEAVYDVKKSQNPMACASPGNYVPYTVSVNDGLILVFRGDPITGEVIGSYSIPAGDDSKEPVYVGFGSGKDKVQFAEIKVGDPVDIVVSDRVYLSDESQEMTIPAGTDATWADFPFRIQDQGAFNFGVQAGKELNVYFGSKKDLKVGHYAITIDSESMVVKKWNIKKQLYENLVAPVVIDHLVDFAFQQEIKPIWVSYNEGVFVIGSGSLGDAVFLVVNDPTPYGNISQIGFSASAGAALKGFQVAPPVAFGYKVGDQLYQKPRVMPKFSGSMKIILPFVYTLAQEKEKISCLDGVSNEKKIVQNTQQQGARYHYGVMLDKSGGLSLQSVADPDNPIRDKMLRDALVKKMQAERQLIDAQATERVGVLKLELANAQAELDRAKASAGMNTANFMRDTGATLVQSAGSIPFPPATMVIAGIGTALAAGSIIRAGLTELNLQDAAKKELDGQKLLNDAKQMALTQQTAAQKVQADAQYLESQASSMFKDPNSVGYVDQATARSLGTQSISDVAKAHKDQLVQMLQEMKGIADYAKFVDACETMINVVDDYFVVQEAVNKDAVWKNISQLYTMYKAQAATLDPTMHSRTINVLFLALNNLYLADDTQMGNCYTWINAIVKNALVTLKQKDFDLQQQFGEYVWYPMPLPDKDQGVFLFQVSGQHDLFICLSPVNNKRIKGTETELYEVLFGGWNNTKTALRLKNLGKSVAEVTQKNNQDAVLDPQEFRTFWISCNNGEITIGRDQPGENVVLVWKDPYPITGIRYIGLSCWDAPVTVRNMVVGKDIQSMAAVWKQMSGQPQEEAPVFVEEASETVGDVEQEVASGDVTPEGVSEASEVVDPTGATEGDVQGDEQLQEELATA